MEDLVRETQVGLAKDKTQYFEKITLGAGAAIAAVVSFVGVHSHRLEPPWLLRAALMAMVVTLVGGLYRNWRHPYYVMSVMESSYWLAIQNRERAKRDFFLSVPARSIQDGKFVNGAAWAADYEPKDVLLTKKIDGLKHATSRTYSEVKISEFVTLFSGVAAMSLLIALAWRNF